MSGQPDEQGGWERLADLLLDEVRLVGAPSAMNKHARAGWAMGMARAAHLVRSYAAPSAPSGDHGGLRGAVEALAGQYDREADLICPRHEYDRNDKAWRVASVRRRVADDLRAALAAHPVPEPAQVGEVGAVLAEHELVGKSVPAGDDHDCRLITKPHDGCGCTRIIIGCTGCDWVTEADGNQGEAHRLHLAAVLVAAGVSR